MTLHELWELFPIVLSDHKNCWTEWAEDEIKHLRVLLSDYNPVINHVGSTAIPDIHAKPIIDIIIEIPLESEWSEIKNMMISKGYICMSESMNRISFNKGYTPSGYAEKVYHLHFRRSGDNDEIAFRDYLISHPDSAKEYEQLKLSMLPAYKNDREGYTAAKASLVNRILALAKNV